ncbi:major capsid protein [Dialister succinatiphilus]|uniref:major capsid protein n=1 Tax=Dialister succinatiphilus TaxID=487173 RepID=UPI0040271694
MAVTLEQAKLNVQDDLQKAVIDEFQKSNWLWANLQFENVVNPSGGGATLTYAYLRVKTQPTAAFRAINEEYTAQEATKEKITADLAIFGGSYKIDRIIARMAGDEVAFQASQKIKAASALFNETVINGDTATNTKAFDGLEKALTGSSTEVKPATAIDLSGSSEMDTNYKSFLDAVDEMLGNMDGTPSALLMGSKMYNKFRGVIRRATAYQETKDAFGRIIPMYDGIPLVDLGAKSGSNDPVVAIDGTAGTTSIYAVRLGLDGLHAISLAGPSPVSANLPDFSKSGAVKEGDVEMVAAIALKATKAAAVLRNIKVK